jgi:hypothetical protein
MEYDCLDPGSYLARLLSTFRSIRRTTIRQQIFGEQKCEYCVEFMSAVQCIENMSYGAHQWASQLVTGVFVGDRNRPRTFLIIAFANANSDGTPNPLSFLVPLNAVGGKLLVCFAPGSMTPITEGLYWKGDELLPDCFEDRERLWEPLKLGLWPPSTERHSDRLTDQSEGQLGAAAVTLDGMSYRDSVKALVRYLAESKERLTDEIFR